MEFRLFDLVLERVSTREVHVVFVLYARSQNISGEEKDVTKEREEGGSLPYGVVIPVTIVLQLLLW